MNIFVLDVRPEVAAKQQLDKHVVKMVVEYAQLLSTAHRVLDGTLTQVSDPQQRVKPRSLLLLPGEQAQVAEIEAGKFRWVISNAQCYKATHANHPSAVWARETDANYRWLFSLFEATAQEYTHRYKREHKTWLDQQSFLREPPRSIKAGELTQFALAMPDEYKVKNDPVSSYRNYYNGSKARMAAWTNREIPSWFNPKETYSDRNTTKPS